MLFSQAIKSDLLTKMYSSSITKKDGRSISAFRSAEWNPAYG